jgi:hypothetical protein
MLGGANANIAGGYAAWHMSDNYTYCFIGQPFDNHEVVYDNDAKVMLASDRPSDMDIFTYQDRTYDYLVTRFHGLGFKKLRESEYCTTWEATGRYAEIAWGHLTNAMVPTEFNAIKLPRKPKLPIQLIKPLFGDCLEKVLDHFDFYAIKFALLDENKVLAHDRAVEMQSTKKLVSAHPEQLMDMPFTVLGRYMKYAQKGYKVNYMDLYRLVATAQSRDLRFSDLSIEEIQELVVHFGRYIHNTNSLGSRGEDFRPTMEEAYGEWLRYLLSKKLN